jgi:hypothetical protein
MLGIPSWMWVIFACLALIVGSRWMILRVYRQSVRLDYIRFLAEAHPQLAVLKQREKYLLIRSAQTGTAQIFLRKLYLAIAYLEPDTPEKRRELYEHFTGPLFELGDGMGDLTLEEHGRRLFPRLVKPEFLAGIEVKSKLLHIPLGNTGLHVVYVLELDKSVVFLNDKHRRGMGLGLEELHDRALENLQRRFSKDVVREVIVKKTFPVIKAHDTYDAARLLLVPRYLEEGEAIAAAIPDRDSLLLAPLPDGGDWTALRKLARTPAGEHVLLDKPLKVTCQGFEVV